MHFKVKQIETGEIHLVWKLLDTLEGQHIWSVTWEGHHIIGQDCEWYSAPPTTEQTELWKEMLQHAYDNDKIIYSQIDLDNIILNLSDKYSITRKQEVSGDDSITLTHAEIIKIMSEWGLLCMKSKPPDYSNDVAEFYSDKIITKSSRKQEVPEAVEFAEWCVEFYGWSDTDELWVDNQGEKYSGAELYELYKKQKP